MLIDVCFMLYACVQCTCVHKRIEDNRKMPLAFAQRSILSLLCFLYGSVLLVISITHSYIYWFPILVVVYKGVPFAEVYTESPKRVNYHKSWKPIKKKKNLKNTPTRTIWPQFFRFISPEIRLKFDIILFFT